jgi:peptidoglycan/LPS O-acetylase OafA/YrhL
MGYVGALDGVRALAVALVMASHLHVDAFRAGEIGVTVFFALSGYLITRLLLEEHRDRERISLSLFYKRRFLRLLPPLYLMLAAMVVVHLVAPGFTNVSWLGIALAATYTTDLGIVASTTYPSPATDHTWSLSGEEQFYFVLPILVVVAMRQRWRMVTLARFAVAFTLIGGSVTAALAAQHAQGNLRLVANPLVRGWEFLAGAAVAVAMMTDAWQLRAWLVRHRRPAVVIVLVAAATLIASVLTPGFTEHNMTSGVAFGLAISSALIAAVLAEGIEVPGMRWMSSRVATWVGRRSYAVYLWHVPIFQLVYHYHGALGVAQAAVIQVVLSLIAAELSYWLVEHPFAAMRRRLRPA